MEPARLRFTSLKSPRFSGEKRCSKYLDFCATWLSPARRSRKVVIWNAPASVTDGRFFQITPEGDIVWEYVPPWPFSTVGCLGDVVAIAGLRWNGAVRQPNPAPFRMLRYIRWAATHNPS